MLSGASGLVEGCLMRLQLDGVNAPIASLHPDG